MADAQKHMSAPHPHSGCLMDSAVLQPNYRLQHVGEGEAKSAQSTCVWMAFGAALGFAKGWSPKRSASRMAAASCTSSSEPGAGSPEILLSTAIGTIDGSSNGESSASTDFLECMQGCCNTEFRRTSLSVVRKQHQCVLVCMLLTPGWPSAQNRAPGLRSWSLHSSWVRSM